MTLWQRDRDTVWAINAVCSSNYHRSRPSLGWHRGSYGRLIHVAEARLPYGWAGGKGRAMARTVTHIPDRVILAWRGGRLAGWAAVWSCGSKSTEPQFLLEPLPGRPVCWQCRHYAGIDT